MEIQRFWSIIEEARRAAPSDGPFLSEIERVLGTLTAEELVAFDGHIDTCMASSYRNDLWAAAYIINGGCSDDGFDYFRAWLISMGQQTFESAIRDPATLEKVLVMDSGWDAELEEFLYVARNAYEKVTQQEMPYAPQPQWELAGPDWDEDSVDDMFPELSKKANSRYS